MIPRALCAAVIAIAAPACSVGFGSAYVGQWREREQVDYQVCVEDDAGHCQSRGTVTSHVPARRFWGMQLGYPAIGMSVVDGDDGSEPAFRFELSAEYLRGEGRFGLGVRAGVTMDLFGVEDGSVVAVPVMLLGHVGLSERFSAYGGIGYLPLSRVHPGADRPDVMPVDSHLGARVLGGLQTVLTRSHEDNRIIWAIELDRMWIDAGDRSLRSFGVVTQLGISM